MDSLYVLTCMNCSMFRMPNTFKIKPNGGFKPRSFGVLVFVIGLK
jgi:hypothetical protein